MNPLRWFLDHVLSERQTLVFVIAVWFVASLQSCAVYFPEPDFHFTDDKGTSVTYLELFGRRMKLVSFRESFFWYWIGLHALAIFVAVKLRSRIGLSLTIILPMLWVFLIVRRFTPGQG
ncbi:MAG: hypothetical protein AAB403_09710 [Planctomycetota bacterium]